MPKVLQLAQRGTGAVKTMGAQLKGQLSQVQTKLGRVQLISPIVDRLLKYNPKLNIRIEYSRGLS